MSLTRILLAFALFGPLVLGVSLAAVAFVLIRRALRSSVTAHTGHPTRHPWPTLLFASFFWVAVMSLASWVGLLVAFGSAWAEAHAPRPAAPTFPTHLVAFLTGNAIVMAAIALLLVLLVRARYAKSSLRPSDLVPAPRS